MRHPRLLLCFFALLISVSVFAQQTGSISGKIKAADGSALPGVTVEARSNVLPQARVTTSDAAGDFSLPALVPGAYTLTFTLSGMQTATRRAEVLLDQNTPVNVSLGMAGVSENITVTAEASMVDKESTAIQSGLSNEQIQALPVSQEYRDLQKLIPGVMYTQDQVRGPSAGGSGQDNVYQFDGVNVTLPLFGTLSAEPATHDIAQVSVTKGGAKAVDFDRAGGFSIDSVSKSGTNKLTGQVSYQTQRHSFTSTPAIASTRFEEDKDWLTLNLGGPILRDRLFFYGSYYRPTRTRDNRANLYGALPAYSSRRNEEFGKLTFSPTSSILLNGSYRTSTRRDESNLFTSTQAGTTGTADVGKLKIAIGEGSWVINNHSFATFKLNDFANKTSGVPTNLSDVGFSTAAGSKIDINNLGSIGLLTVPCPSVTAGATRCSLANIISTPANNFQAPYVAKYGYASGGTQVGGGSVGIFSQIDRDDFGRKAGQAGYNISLGNARVTHDLHAGFQRYTDSEDLERSTNGFGSITIPGGGTTCAASICGTSQPIYFQAAVQQQDVTVPPIHSEYQSQNLEINDSIKWGNWSFNVGLLAGHDQLFGQGLKETDNLAGYVSSPGTKYKMYDIPWSKLYQPRLGATWAYNGTDTVYAAYDIYHPTATSLPRAASWDRNLRNTVNLYYDQTGTLIGVDPVKSSSGKLFVPDMTPRTVDEYLIGTAQQFNSDFSGRLYTRYRKTTHFWEDTPNTARIDCGATSANLALNPAKCNPPSNVPREAYIPNLDDQRLAIGNGLVRSGSTYVIADLDGAFTKYYEATAEGDWRHGTNFVHASYTWSHYYGNFDQDNTTGAGAGAGVGPDQNSFIGSSNMADGPGRNIWDMKYGDLHGDRRHMLKVYGGHELAWRANIGAYFVYQSGQPWEAWDYHVYQPLTGTNTSDTIRFAEPAGSRRSPMHHQLDLNYTQNFPVAAMNLQLALDMFNVYNKRTGYNPQPSLNTSTFGQAQNAFDPRRFQVALRLQF
jgi:hypothetical protein